MKVILAFGTFDRFHEGHVHYLQEAKKLGDRLVVSVALDAHVRSLKHKEPTRSEKERLQHIASLPYVDEAILSDDVLGSYSILEKVQPNIVALGHDQYELEESLRLYLKETHNLRLFSIKIVRLEKYVPSNMDRTG